MSDLIITRTPYRISLGGGGTDLPFYCRENEGFLITAAINQYCTISVSFRELDKKILTQTTEVQFSDKLDDLNNGIIRECLRYFKIKNSIQVATFTTLPTGIGLGTSSTLTVGLVNALCKIKDLKKSKIEMAEIAYKIEREILGWEGGVQDQYIASIGSLIKMTINNISDVKVERLLINEDIKKILEQSLLLIYSEQKRDSHDIIESQNIDEKKTINIYHKIKNLGYKSVKPIMNGDVQKIGEIMDEHWAIKKSISNKISNTRLDDTYKELKSFGSPGGKIIGAGGGGFFMMAVPKNIDHYKKLIKDRGYKTLDWSFDNLGTHKINKLGY